METAWPELTLNVNVSRFTLSEPDYLTRVDKIIAETGADPTRLVFEVTESFVEINLESLSDVLNGLVARGITVAIDDFGVNASNLNTLGLSQFSIAKLDKSLIDQAEHSERMQYVVKAAIELCHKLKMLCVAEGIETDSQIELLKALGCDRLQGYLIGKPMPAAEFFINLERLLSTKIGKGLEKYENLHKPAWSACSACICNDDHRNDRRTDPHCTGSRHIDILRCTCKPYLLRGHSVGAKQRHRERIQRKIQPGWENYGGTVLHDAVEEHSGG